MTWSLVERVYHEIKWRIVNGTYRPGADLSEATLARIHRASRTPIRQALARLSEERYVVWVAGHGFTIAPVTLAMLRNTFEVRRVVEAAGGVAAAERATADDVARMREVADYVYSPGSVESRREAMARNLAFHLAVAHAAHNELLADLVGQCLMHTDRVLALDADLTLVEEGPQNDHTRIVDAIEAHDGAAARAAVEAHLDRTSRTTLDHVTRGTIRGIQL